MNAPQPITISDFPYFADYLAYMNRESYRQQIEDEVTALERLGIMLTLKWQEDANGVERPEFLDERTGTFMLIGRETVQEALERHNRKFVIEGRQR